MTASAIRALPRRSPGLVVTLVVLAPFLIELVILALPPLPPPHGWYWENLLGQSAFLAAPLALVFFGRSLSWGSVGLSRTGLAPSLALGLLYALILVAPQLVLVRLGVLEPGTQVGEPSLFLGFPLALVLYFLFWGLFEGVWMCYLIYAVNRWPTGGQALTWRALFLAALVFGLLHSYTQVVAYGASPPQALFSLSIGLALLIPGTIPKLTGNAWGLVLWFAITNFGIPNVGG